MLRKIVHMFAVNHHLKKVSLHLGQRSILGTDYHTKEEQAQAVIGKYGCAECQPTSRFTQLGPVKLCVITLLRLHVII